MGTISQEDYHPPLRSQIGQAPNRFLRTTLPPGYVGKAIHLHHICELLVLIDAAAMALRLNRRFGRIWRCDLAAAERREWLDRRAVDSTTAHRSAWPGS